MADSTFGSELRRLRTAAGLSLSDLATRIHYSKGYLSKVENGMVQPNHTLAALCDETLDSGGVLVAVVPLFRRQRGRPRISPAQRSGRPADIAQFVGRAPESAELRAFLGDEGPSAPVACVVAGMAGVGKTAFVIHVAHEVEASFPHGCLFLDLRGFCPDGPEVSATEALDRLLRMLGVPGEQIPADPDQRAALYRDHLAGRRALIVLDNANDPAQVRPLLPGDSASRVVVTSRNALVSLDDAYRIPLDVLSLAEATTLFGSVGHRPPGDPADPVADSMADVVRRCGRLPLAVRIAAARYRANPTMSLAELAGRLSDETGLLHELDDGERSVAAALALSYRALPADQQRLFALLALHPGSDTDAYGAAALGDLEPPESSRLAERLADAHLLVRRAGGRYEFHDLLRLFAQQTAARQLDPVHRAAALARLIDSAVHAVRAAERRLNPLRFIPDLNCPEPLAAQREFGTMEAAKAWLRDEWPNLVAVCRTAGAQGLDERCWQLAYLLRGYFFLAKLWDPWVRTHEYALRSARACGNRWAEGATLNNLGVAHIDRGEIELASSYYRQAMTVFEAIGDERGRVTSLANLGWAHHYGGDQDAARRDLGAALAFYRNADAQRNVAITLRGLALAETELGAYPAAIDHATEALHMLDDIESRHGESGLEHDRAMAFNCLGWALFRAGDPDRSAAAYRNAVTFGETAGSDYELARAETGLGNIAAAGDRPAEAQWYWDRAEAHHPGLDAIMVGESRLRQAAGHGG